MDAKALEHFLEQQDACEEARDWQRGKHLKEVWATCGRADWLLWLVDRAVNMRKLAALQRTLMLVAVELAESVLHLVPTDEERPRAALALVRQWLAREDVSHEQLREMAKAAETAYWAARARAAGAAWAARAWAAFWAAEAARTAAWAARAADEARAAEAVRAAFWAARAARAAKAPELQAKQADIVRKHLPYEIIAPLFHN